MGRWRFDSPNMRRSKHLRSHRDDEVGQRPSADAGSSGSTICDAFRFDLRIHLANSDEDSQGGFRIHGDVEPDFTVFAS